MTRLREELPKRFPGCTFFFQAADIVNQVLNFGQPSPIDIRVVGSDPAKTYALAQRVAKDIGQVSGVVDSHVYQVPDVPSLRFNVNRTVAQQVGLTQETAANSLLVSLNSSIQIAPTFWVNPATGISYPLVAQAPTYNVNSLDELRTMPLAASSTASGPAGNRGQGQLLMNIADIVRTQVPALVSQHNVRPVYDVNANVQGRDLYSVAGEIQHVMDKDRPPAAEPITVSLTGQIDTMEKSYSGLFSGMGLAVVLVFLLMVINFQSWLSPFIVLLAVPFGLSGVMWGLFLTHTYMSVPALMGALMCIGLTTANSILVVVFANERLAEGYSPAEAAVAAGYTRLRPVLMTAGAMIIGMLPMALGLGEGGEQNAPLGRAVIGGLSFATFATLVFVPAMYELLNRRSARRRAQEGHSDDGNPVQHEPPTTRPEYSA
jgi:multidrug efflux pump subunit AcrB